MAKKEVGDPIRINYTVKVDERFRKALRSYYNKTGEATDEEVKRFYKSYGDSEVELMLQEYDEKERTAAYHKKMGL